MSVSDPAIWIGGCALLLSMYQEFRHRRADRHQLRLSAEFEREVVRLKMVNAGRRNIRVSSIHYETTRGEEREMFLHDGISRMLEPGEVHWVTLGTKVFDWDPPVFGLFVKDSLGEKWALAHPDFLRVQQQARAENAKKK
jgi:hypothetical protein